MDDFVPLDVDDDDDSERMKVIRERNELLARLNRTVSDRPGVSRRELAHSLGIDDFQIDFYRLLPEEDEQEG